MNTIIIHGLKIRQLMISLNMTKMQAGMTPAQWAASRNKKLL